MTAAELHAHPTYREWVRCLRAAPDRALMAADWIEEQGCPERADFVRLQCRLAEMDDLGLGVDPAGGHAAEYERLRGLEAEWWDRHGIDWFPELLPAMLPYGLVESFTLAPPRTGFVTGLRGSADLWLRHGDGVYAAHPVREVELTTWPRVERVVKGGVVSGYRLAGRGRVHPTAAAVAMLEAEWPGVAFTPPPARLALAGVRAEST